MQDSFRRIKLRNLFSGGFRFELFANKFLEFAIGIGLIHEIEKLRIEIGYLNPIISFATAQHLRYELFATFKIVKEESLSFDVWGGYGPLIEDFGIARFNCPC